MERSSELDWIVRFAQVNVSKLQIEAHLRAVLPPRMFTLPMFIVDEFSLKPVDGLLVVLR